MHATQDRHSPLKGGFSMPRGHATSHTPHACHSRQTQPTQRWVFNAKSTCDTTRTTCMPLKTDTAHSKMGSRCQEGMQHHTHHMCATHGRHNPLKDGFSMPRAHATSHTPHACHSRQTQPIQKWVFNAKSTCDTTRTTCMPLKTDTAHSKMGSRCQEHMRHHTTTCMPLKTDTAHSKVGFQCQEGMQHHTHHMHATQDRHSPLKGGFSMPRGHATSHTPHVCNPQQTQPTQGWVLDAKSACDTTHTTCMPLKTDTAHSKVGFQCQEGMQHHTHHMHATQDRHSPLKDGFSMPRAHATPHTPHACHSRQTQPTQRWVFNAKRACNITHTTCMPLKTDTAHSKVGFQCQEGMQHHTHHMCATHSRHNPLKDGFSMPRAHVTPHTPHACHSRQTQPTQRWVFNAKRACNITRTTCMPLKTDTAHSKGGFQCQEGMQHHTHHMHATQDRHSPLKGGFSMPRAHATPHAPHACHSRQTQPTQRWVLDAKRACNITHTPHVCNPRQTQATQGWVFNTKSACDTTHTTCMPLKTDTAHSKVGFQCQEGMQHHTHHMHATQDRHSPLRGGFSMPRAHATPHAPHACHSRQTQPTQRWVLDAKRACNITHTTCVQPTADTTHSRMGSRCQERM